MRAMFAIGWVFGAWLSLFQWSPGAKSSMELSPRLGREALRQRVVGLVEDLVQRERFYQRRTGTFTPILARLEFEIPEELRAYVQVQVIEAGRNRLIVRAYSDSGNLDERESGSEFDEVWSNENFQIQASFPVVGRRMSALSSEAALPELSIERIGDSAVVEQAFSASSR